MKISIFFFSGTGNTWWVIQEFKKIAIERNNAVELYNIEKPDEFDLQKIVSGTDVLGIAYPIYGSDIPRNMRSFLENLVVQIKDFPIESKPVALVLTSMLFFSGDGALLPRKYLKKANIQLNWAKNIALNSNISIPGFRANPVSSTKLNKRMKKAGEILNNLIIDMEKGKKRLRIQWGLLGLFFGWIQRSVEKMMYNVLKFSVDSERCIKCLKCVKECPVENILYDEISEKFTFLDKCVWCMRCYTRCPTQAILARGRYCDPNKFKRMKPISKDFRIN